jgi:predicted DCC family thiol-disulfide oxidoreductase YuxK
MKSLKAYDVASREVLIYDGTCPICSGTAKWIRDNATDGSFDLLPCQSLRDGERPGVKRADCLQAMHLVLPDGTVLIGEQALPEIFTRLRKYRFAGALFKLPRAAALSRIAYRWFASRRYRIAAMLSHLPGGKKRDT